MDAFRLINFILDIVVLAAIIYVVVFLLPKDQEAYKQCNMKILCENNKLPKEYDEICSTYKNIQVSIPNISIN